MFYLQMMKGFCFMLLSNPADVLWNANKVQETSTAAMFSFVHSD